MRALGRNTITTTLVLMTLFVSRPRPLWADGDGKNEETKAKPASLEAPSPLTERERWLLDRMEQLEKRVAELETKGDTSATHVSGAATAPTAPLNAAIGSLQQTQRLQPRR